MADQDDEGLTPLEQEILRRNDPRIADAGQKIARKPRQESEQEGTAENLDPPVEDEGSDTLSTGAITRGGG